MFENDFRLRLKQVSLLTAQLSAAVVAAPQKMLKFFVQYWHWTVFDMLPQKDDMVKLSMYTFVR